MSRKNWPNVVGAMTSDGGIVVGQSGRSFDVFVRTPAGTGVVQRQARKMSFDASATEILLKALREVLVKKGEPDFSRGSLAFRIEFGQTPIATLFEISRETIFPRYFWEEAERPADGYYRLRAGRGWASHVHALIEWELGTKELQAQPDRRLCVSLADRPNPNGFWKPPYIGARVFAEQNVRGPEYVLEPIDQGGEVPVFDTTLGYFERDGKRFPVALTVTPPGSEKPEEITWTHRIHFKEGDK